MGKSGIYLNLISEIKINPKKIKLLGLQSEKLAQIIRYQNLIHNLCFIFLFESCKITGTWWGFFGKGNYKREIFLKNLGLYNEKGQSDQEHLHFIFYCGFIFYENLGDCY